MTLTAVHKLACLTLEFGVLLKVQDQLIARMHARGKWEADRAAEDGLDALVLDDIYTSGGAVQSFAAALRNAGARGVRAVVLARNVGATPAAWVLSLLRHHRAQGRRWTPGAGADDTLVRDRAAVMPAAWTAVSRRDAGTRDRAGRATRAALQPGRRAGPAAVCRVHPAGECLDRLGREA